MRNGYFVISLDFELHWGIFDHTTILDYEENLKNVELVIHRLLEMSERFAVKITFSTVGLLFAENKEQLRAFLPSELPSYALNKFNPYRLISTIGENRKEDPFHYARSIIKTIKVALIHEIGTHTFCHYYCAERGQTVDQFRQDLVSAIGIAKSMDIDIKSIVFPRNQVVKEYLEVCKELGITNYRGTEKSRVYRPVSSEKNVLMSRIIRFLDSYVNITGSNTYDPKMLLMENGMANIPSSRFLRPYNKSLHLLERYKLNRIKKAMRIAAINNEVFHIWWHPHNFGKDMEPNFNNLEQIFMAYKKLNKVHRFESITMTNLSKKIT